MTEICIECIECIECRILVARHCLMGALERLV